MSDLADLAFDVAGDLPAQARKVIDTAVANGWELNPPGMTLCLRLNHPSDDLAQPVYVCWAVGRTPSGRLSFKFHGASTKGLVPLSGADLLEYLADPTVAYMTDEDIAEADAKRTEKDRKPWDQSESLVVNLRRQLGAEVIGIETEQPQRAREVKPSASPRVPMSPLRVKIPGT